MNVVFLLSDLPVIIDVLYTLITCLTAFVRSIIIVITGKHAIAALSVLTLTIGVGGCTVISVGLPFCTGITLGEADPPC